MKINAMFCFQRIFFPSSCTFLRVALRVFISFSLSVLTVVNAFAVFCLSSAVDGVAWDAGVVVAAFLGSDLVLESVDLGTDTGAYGVLLGFAFGATLTDAALDWVSAVVNF